VQQSEDETAAAAVAAADPAPAPAPASEASAASSTTPNTAVVPPASDPAPAAAAGVGAGEEGKRRVATHDYKATDEDELGFSKGDTIQILPFPDPDLEVGHLSPCLRPLCFKGVCIHVFQRGFVFMVFKSTPSLTAPQSEGWLYGRVGDREGVFPLNFTAEVS
jgi:hypothetical protein